MIRPAAFALVLIAGVASAAPIPKEVRVGPTHVGKWQTVNLDPNDPQKIRSYGQFWFLAEDGSFTYQDATAVGPPPKRTELLVFDPASGHVEHSMGGPNEKPRLGRYKIEGDRLTMNLNTNAAAPRPNGLAVERDGNVWILQRVGDRK